MKIFKIILIIFAIFFVTGYENSVSNSNLEGTYISKSPKRSDMIMMYLRGSFNSVYTAPDNHLLVLHKDSTFDYSIMKCNTDKQNYTGKWLLENKKLKLDYYDKNIEDIEFSVKKDKFYRISDFTVLKNNKKIKCLTILKKQ